MRSPPSFMPPVIPPPAVVIPGSVFISRTDTDRIPPPSLPGDQRFQIPQVVIIVIIVLTSIFLSVTCYVAFIKHCPTWTRILNWTNRDPPASDHQVAGDPSLTHDGEQVDHPIWLMTSVGLQPSVINSIKVTTFKSEEGLVEEIDCSVCLGEFQEDDSLRILPKCNHAFHVICIDTWLGSHTNCPLCRADVVVTSPSPCLGPNEPRLRQLRWADLPQMEDSDSSDVDEGNNQTGSSNTGHSYEVDSTSNNNSNDQTKTEDGARICFSLEVVHGSNSQIMDDMLSKTNNASSSSFRLTSSLTWSPPVTKKRSYSWCEKVH